MDDGAPRDAGQASLVPRRAAVEKQNWGLSGGDEEGWVITPALGGSAAFAVDRASEVVHKIPASVTDAVANLGNSGSHNRAQSFRSGLGGLQQYLLERECVQTLVLTRSSSSRGVTTRCPGFMAASDWLKTSRCSRRGSSPHLELLCSKLDGTS